MFRDEFWQEAYLCALQGAMAGGRRPETTDPVRAADKALEEYDRRFDEGGRFKKNGNNVGSRSR